MASSKSILAIVVLYKMSFQASPSYSALNAALRDRPELAGKIDLLVVDNSPEAQPLPADFLGQYLHDRTNPGLARRYNYALAAAAASRAAWLLLLDQDTTLTAAYIEEIETLSERLAGEEKIVAIVPKLLSGGALQSPHLPRYRRPSHTVDLSSYGVTGGLVRVYNSGALLRVSAVQAIGGFPEAYWLDYLDHATFHQLQARGGEIYVMHARLDHDMSILRPDKHKDLGNAVRHKNQLAAEVRFYRDFGSLQERLRDRAALARQAFHSIRRGLFAEAARWLSAAFAMGAEPEERRGEEL